MSTQQELENLENTIKHHFDCGRKHWHENLLENARDELTQVLLAVRQSRNLLEQSNPQEDAGINLADYRSWLKEMEVRTRDLRGRVYLARDENGDAKKDLKRVIESGHASSRTFMSCGVAHQRLSELTEALKCFDRAIELNDNVDAFARRGHIYLERREEGDFDRAMLDLKRAIQLDNKHDYALAYCGKAYWIKGERGKALTYFSRALKENPENTVALSYRGITRYQLRQYTVALNDFNQYVESFGDNNSDVFAYRGMAHQAEGHNKEAADDYQHALDLGIEDRELQDSVKKGLDEVRRRMRGNRR
jgi:tetratricopeptide (TPR) repeat protein